MEELEKYLETEIFKEKTLKQISEKFETSEFNILGIVYKLKEKGINIDYYEKDGNAYLIRNDHPDLSKENTFYIQEDVNEMSHFAVISDLHFGSRYEQIEILNDMYKKFQKQGINKVFVVGNLLEGKYSKKKYSEFGKSLISNDAYGQADHFIEYYPHVDGITTYFITGKLDHEWGNKLNVGNYIAKNRKDLIYLGPISCTVHMNNTVFCFEQVKNGNTYTKAYAPQKYSRSMSSNEDYDAIFLGGTNSFQFFPSLRDTQVFAIPSVVDRTALMKNDTVDNTMGAYLFDLEYNKNGTMKRIIPTIMPYFYPSEKNYLNVKKLNITSTEKEIEEEKVNSKYFDTIDKIYRSIRKEESFNSLKDRLGITENELFGIISYLQNIGYQIEVKSINNELIVFKNAKRVHNTELKPKMEELHQKTFGVVSDTHYGSIWCQPSMVNTFCYEAYNRGIDTIFHVGDITDGDYSRIRPNHIHEVFLFGATGQANYVIDNLPKYKGMHWYAIAGSHDQTHQFNYGIVLGEEVEKKRDDFTYLGQDRAVYYFDNCPIEIFHPGGGTSRILSTKPQNGIDQMSSSDKTALTLRGHYHKEYYMMYRNMHTLLCPCNVDQSSFMMKNEIPNLMGDYFVTIYYDDEGHIHYFNIEAMMFDKKDVRENDYENPTRYMKNKILTKKRV